MNNLKHFLVQEAIDEQHAKRLLDYQSKFHHEALLELQKRLGEAWTTVLKKSKLDPNQEAVQELEFKNPGKACTSAEVSAAPKKLTLTRFSSPKEVVLLAKISLAFSEAQRKQLRKELLNTAATVMEGLIDDWPTAFKSEEPNGTISTSFKVTKHDHEVRLTFETKTGSSSSHKGIFMVGTEFGKPGTKLRDHDLLYLIDLL